MEVYMSDLVSLLERQFQERSNVEACRLQWLLTLGMGRRSKCAPHLDMLKNDVQD